MKKITNGINKHVFTQPLTEDLNAYNTLVKMDVHGINGFVNTLLNKGFHKY